ncbi:membrane fusion protein Use1-domain-containing protein [Hygrophoropsis aurantiaca]|uniref:Membrane fusion protein Use1-domain-containing protein n=1 Tax=Hygrophoropsis aurantiaca TaxID=72124 RepID=A0ACB8AUD6_9AGAM|nr:membrane fusion protein Use1-domain-containing protein [Hygrophoropsis aurantiaca]
MTFHNSEQAIHDKINLPRLVKKLEKHVTEQDWTSTRNANRNDWIKAQGTLQGIRHARTLLKNVEADDADISPASEQRYQRMRLTLDRLETFVVVVEKRAAPQMKRPRPILPSIPEPQSKPPTLQDPVISQSPSVEATLLPAEGDSDVAAILPLGNELLPPVESSPSSSQHTETTLKPSTFSAAIPPSSTNINATPTILQNSRALQEELSEQLALMATQLRRNATYFSESLDKDKSVVEEMQEKLEGNFDIMKRQRIRLRDFRGKSGSTTCLVIMSIIVVLVAFIIMILIIRVT